MHTKAIEQLAVIGSTASGKTALSIELAEKMNAHILSLDSLAIYKEIDIVSAKPTPVERKGILHFGLDYLCPDDAFDVTTFIDLYHTVYARCQNENKNLIIVGGTSFYLKMLLEGISNVPTISKAAKQKAEEYIKDLNATYEWLADLDSDYMSKIASNDRYRIEKALHIYLETGLTPSAYFNENPPIPTIQAPLPIYQILWGKELLRKRIALRTSLMLEGGLIDEICMLEQKYSRTPNCMKAIGIKETLDFLDGIYDKETLREKITTNTARLAKRQNTFNNSQFNHVISGDIQTLQKKLQKRYVL